MKRDKATDGKAIICFSNGFSMRVVDIYIGICLILIAFLLAFISLNVGVANASFVDFWHIICGLQLSDEKTYAIVMVRLPHIILGFLVGWCLALAGAILQPIARNPLADPGLFGINHGAMTSIILLLAFVPAAPKILIVICAIAGGLVVAFLLIWLVGNEKSSGLAILLMGVALATVLASINSFLILYLPPDLSFNLSTWLAGTLFNANWDAIAAFAPLFLISVIGIFMSGRSLQRYELGNEIAMALGESVKYSRPALMFFSVFLSASSVTAVGPIMFLSILAPQLASFLSSATGCARLFLSALIGGNVVILADIVTKIGFGSQGLPLGLSFTLLGVPLFIFALRLRTLRYRASD